MSSAQNEIAAIERLQASQSNIKVTIGITIGTILLLYFFSFAQLVDAGQTAGWLFETATTVLCVLGLIYLNRISFFILKLRYKRRAEFTKIFPVLTASNIDEKAEELAQRITQQASLSGT